MWPKKKCHCEERSDAAVSRTLSFCMLGKQKLFAYSDNPLINLCQNASLAMALTGDGLKYEIQFTIMRDVIMSDRRERKISFGFGQLVEIFRPLRSLRMTETTTICCAGFAMTLPRAMGWKEQLILLLLLILHQRQRTGGIHDDNR